MFLALQPPREPRTPALIIALVGAAALLLTGIAFFSLNSALNTISQLGSSLGSLVRVNYQAGFGLGFWVALVSAGATIAGGVSGLSGLAPRETSPMTQRVVTPAPMSPSYRPSPTPAPDLTPTPLPKTVSGPRAQLRLESGPARGKTFEVRTGDIMIGRGSQCDIQVKDTTVSRVHAQIRYGQGAWFIQDQQSGYGTFVNEQRVPAIRLNANDRVRIGDDTTFTFLVE